MTVRTDQVHLVCDPASGVEAIQARFAAHAYDLHRHDDWLVGVTDRGVQDFLCRGARQRSTTGRVILIEPQEAHDGQAGAPGGDPRSLPVRCARAFQTRPPGSPDMFTGLGRQVDDMLFDTKVAILVLDDLAIWQKLNVTAFLATGIAAAAPDALGEPYQDAAGRRHAALLGQPMLIFAAGFAGLQRGWRQAIERGLTRAAYVRAMFATGDDAANRAAFLLEPADAPDLVGLALRGPKKDVDKATKGLSLHA